jgi:hypothetical protein
MKRKIPALEIVSVMFISSRSTLLDDFESGIFCSGSYAAPSEAGLKRRVAIKPESGVRSDVSCPESAMHPRCVAARRSGRPWEFLFSSISRQCNGLMSKWCLDSDELGIVRFAQSAHCST